MESYLLPRRSALSTRFIAVALLCFSRLGVALALGVLLSIDTVTRAWADDCINYSLFPHMIGRVATPGQARKVAVRGNHAFVADGGQTLGGPTTVQVINILEPHLPTIVASLTLTDPPLDIVVQGAYAYVAIGADGLAVLNVTNPNSPSVVGTVNTPLTAKSVAVAGSYAYVLDAGTSNALRIISVSNPTSPSIVSSLTMPDRIEDIAVGGSYAYIANGQSGFTIVDVSNPSAPSIVTSAGVSGVALYAIDIRGTYMFAAGNQEIFGSEYGELDVFDVSTPSAPTFADVVYLNDVVLDVALDDRYAYMAVDDYGLQIVDADNPTDLTLVARADTYGEAFSVAVSGKNALVTNFDQGLAVIDIADVEAPPIVGTHETEQNTFGVAIAGDHAYLADRSNLEVVDISDPTSPAHVGGVETPGNAFRVAVSGNYAYVAALNGGLQIVNVQTPSSPTTVATIPAQLPYLYNGVAVNGNRCYVTFSAALPLFTSGSMSRVETDARPAPVASSATINHGLSIINVQNPSSPGILGSVDIEEAFGVATAGNYAYVAAASTGLFVVGVLNPASPVVVGSVDTPGTAVDVTVNGNYAYVADQESGVQVVDVSTPQDPEIVGALDLGGLQATKVAFDGTIGYVSYEPAAGTGVLGGGGVAVVDFSNPLEPILIGSADCLDLASDVTVHGESIYIAIGGDPAFSTYPGLLILPAECATQQVSLANSVAEVRKGTFGYPDATGILVCPRNGDQVSHPGLPADFSLFIRLRTAQNQPVQGVSDIRLELSQCGDPHYPDLPAELLVDAPTDENGETEFRDVFAFGGADTCKFKLYVNGEEWTEFAGGIRSVDVDGDGLVGLPDLSRWQYGFTHNSQPVTDCDYDFDSICALGDLSLFQLHFLASGHNVAPRPGERPKGIASSAAVQGREGNLRGDIYFHVTDRWPENEPPPVVPAGQATPRVGVVGPSGRDVTLWLMASGFDGGLRGAHVRARWPFSWRVLELGGVREGQLFGHREAFTDQRQEFMTVFDCLTGSEPVAIGRIDLHVDRSGVVGFNADAPLVELVDCEGRVSPLGGSGLLAKDPVEEVGKTVRPVSLSRKSAVVNQFGSDFELMVGNQAIVTALVYDVEGRVVRTLLDSERIGPGSRMVSWNGMTNGGQRAASGVYFLRLQASGGVEFTERMVLVR